MERETGAAKEGENRLLQTGAGAETEREQEKTEMLILKVIEREEELTAKTPKERGLMMSIVQKQTGEGRARAENAKIKV